MKPLIYILAALGILAWGFGIGYLGSRVPEGWDELVAFIIAYVTCWACACKAIALVSDALDAEEESP